ncbi:MAG TPA: recombinase family protein [bacterium]|nr:recombinase family protein [bacterium]
MAQKALIYCRVSSEKQVIEGHGLDSQEHRCRQYAALLDLKVEKVFKDDGISGGLFDRPAMKALIKYLDDHWQSKYFVIFDDLKRFARDVRVHLRLKSELKAREAQLRCLNYNFDDSAEGEFIETIFAAQNELERKQNRRQVCQKMKARLERGYWCFCPPTGYEYKQDSLHGKIIMPVYPIADIIAEGLTAFANNTLPRQVDLQAFYESRNLPRLMDSKTVHLEFVKRVLTEPLYAGLIEYPKWEVTRRRGHHRAIISEDTFNANQLKLKKPSGKLRLTDRPEFPLRRYISCGVCGKTMTGSSSGSKDARKHYPHYTCNNKECTTSPKNIGVALVEKQYLQMLSKLKPNKEILALAKLTAERIWSNKKEDIFGKQEAMKSDIQELNRRIDGYVDQIPKTSNKNTRARYESRIEELEAQIQELESALKNKKEPHYSEFLSRVLAMIEKPAEAWKKSDLKTKTMIHNMIFAENPKYTFQDGFMEPKLTKIFRIEHNGATTRISETKLEK